MRGWWPRPSWITIQVYWDVADFQSSDDGDDEESTKSLQFQIRNIFVVAGTHGSYLANRFRFKVSQLYVHSLEVLPWNSTANQSSKFCKPCGSFWVLLGEQFTKWKEEEVLAPRVKRTLIWAFSPRYVIFFLRWDQNQVVSEHAEHWLSWCLFAFTQ
jgi:hypothetical protein